MVLFPNRVESKFRGFSQVPEQFQTNIDVHPFAVLLPSIMITSKKVLQDGILHCSISGQPR